jgi:hypothetical protein
MKKLLLILLCLPFIGFGQNWERFISLVDSNDYFSLYGEQTQDGGYIITGGISNTPTSFGSSDFHLFLLKLDSQGDTVWNKTYQNINGTTMGGIVKQTFDSGYIITANEERYIDSVHNPLIIKTNSYGDTLWTRYFNWISYGQGAASFPIQFDIEQTTDSGFIVNFNGHLIKTDLQCDTLWTKNYEGGAGFGRNISQTTDGGYIFISSTFSPLPITQEAYLTKLDSQGDTLWKKIFNSDSIVNISSVEQTTDEGYIISGNRMNSFFAGGGLSYIPYLTKTDSFGNILWTKTYPYYISYLSSSQQTTDGGYITSMAQLVDTILWKTNIILLKTNNLGDTIWTNSIEVGDSLTEVGYLEQTIDGGYFLVAMIEGRTTKEDGKGIIYLIKTDGNGNVTSTFNIPTINTSKGKLLKIVDMLGRETKGKTNEPLFYIYDDGTVEKRIVIE